MKLRLEHSWAQLPPLMHTAVAPLPVAAPQCIVFNNALATQLGLDARAVEAHAAQLFSGNALPDDAQPLAMAYAGHQFGGFSPQLGDGRAHLLGELRDLQGQRHDLHLKGSGRTPYSRGGDGRAALGPMLREYVISVAMYALGIPTTRSLAVISTGEAVLREDGPLPGAILVRTAASHLRVGSFQFAASRGDGPALRALIDYTITRHYPDVAQAEVPALALLQQVTERQAQLIAQWLRVGFVHGVMNTDNMALSGETIDYGPCAFLDEYDARKVFSSIDHQGRYAFGNQSLLAQWNLARFAETLLPFIASDERKAEQLALDVLDPFIARVDDLYLQTMRVRLGLASREEGDAALVRQLLSLMQHSAADYTLTLRSLADLVADPEAGLRLQSMLPADPHGTAAWLAAWRARLQRDPSDTTARRSQMHAMSPAVIPRNHLVEAALSQASLHGDLQQFLTLLAAVQRPYDEPADALFTTPPAPQERVRRTFCGT